MINNFIVSFLKFFWHLLPIEIRRDLGARFNFIYDYLYTSKISINNNYIKKEIKKVFVFGFVSTPSGLGTAVNLLIKDLEQLGVTYEAYDISLFFENESWKNEKIKFSFDDCDAVIFAVNPDVLIQVISKLEIKDFQSKKIIGYWVWELNEPPKDWKIAEKLIHEIWTPSEFSKNSLSKMFSKPIKVLNHPAGLVDFNYDSLDTKLELRQKYNLDPNSFVIFQSFAFSSSIERKNIIGAISLFKRNFSKHDDAYLLLRYAASENYPLALKRVKEAIGDYRKKILLIPALSYKKELYEYYKMVDAYISLHRSEGFGLNLAEAMQAGLPVIATNWSGNLEFMNSENSLLIDAELIDVKDLDGIYNVKNAKWADPNSDQASNALNEIYKDKELRIKLGNEAKKSIKERLKGSDLIKILN